MHKILMAVDEPSSAKLIIDFLARCPWAQSAQIRVLHAIEPVQAVAAWPSEQYRTDAQALVKQAGASLRQKLPAANIDEMVVEEFAKDAILDVAETWGADTIVLGSHGRRGLTRFLMGSVSTAVSNYAHCSVLIVRTHSIESNAAGRQKVEQLTERA
jgi:nucleotide-binding universal stress UspA family protein